VTDLHLIAFFGDVGSSDGLLHRIRPEDDVRVRIEIDGFDPLLTEDDFALFADGVEGDDVTSVGEQEAPWSWRFADTRNVVDGIESGVTAALVRS